MNYLPELLALSRLPVLSCYSCPLGPFLAFSLSVLFLSLSATNYPKAKLIKSKRLDLSSFHSFSPSDLFYKGLGGHPSVESRGRPRSSDQVGVSRDFALSRRTPL